MTDIVQTDSEGSTRPGQRRPGNDAAPSLRDPLQRFGQGRRPRTARTRWLALVALVPTVPMFFASVAALALFYAAPERFGRWLSRLPGEEVIRGALFFAPATLFAVGVLAALYAIEAPKGKPSVSRPAEGAPAWLPNAVGVALIFASFSTLVLTWVAPGRTTRLLETLPGGVLSLGRLQYAALALGILALAGIAWTFRSRGLAPSRARPSESQVEGAGLAGWARGAAGLVLVPTIPLFVFSLAGLVFSYVEPKAFAGWIERIALDDWIRLGLIFTPTSLAAVLFLALLVLRAQRRPSPGFEPAPARGSQTSPGVWTLVVGLSLSAGMAMGLLGAVALLLLR